MRWLLYVVGFGIILIATIDPLWTTLWVDGHGGPLTRRYADWMRLVLWRIVPEKDHRLLSLTGSLILVTTVVLWATQLWLGWVLLFSADPTAVVQSRTGVPASLAARIYYTGYTLVTMGNGDYVPRDGFWQIMTAIAALSGLFMLTLSVTYLLSIIQAVVTKRAFASHVWALGHSAEELVLHAWDGEWFAHIENEIVSLAQQLSQVTEQHQAYPMLHYYHEANLPQSVAIAVAVYDDAITILEYLVLPIARPAPIALHGARASVRTFLSTLRDAHVTRSEHPAPGIALTPLSAAGIPLVDAATASQRLDELSEHRRLVLGVLQNDHREWPAPGQY